MSQKTEQHEKINQRMIVTSLEYVSAVSLQIEWIFLTCSFGVSATARIQVQQSVNEY